MDFTLSEQHKMLQATVRDFATNKLAPVADELDRKQEFPRDHFKVMAEMGLLGLIIPPEYGGSGGDGLSMAIAMEEIAWACASTCDSLNQKPVVTSRLLDQPLLEMAIPTSLMELRYSLPTQMLLILLSYLLMSQNLVNEV